MSLSHARGISRLVPMDGNAAAAHVAYHMSEAAFLYPITPSSPMGEIYDSNVSKRQKNIWNRVPIVKVLQSEAGAAGALHGAEAVGTFCTTFTASQGLLLMIPNMLKTAGELWPTVFHVAARAVSTQALSIYGDHSDVMLVKNTGFAMLSSSTVQECMDIAAVAHMSTVEAEIPFVHFFEGFRLSHQIDVVNPIPKEQMTELMPFAKLESIRKRALNPAHPFVLGHGQGSDSYFQTVELGNKYYTAIPDIVQANFDKFAKITGRQYKLFDYFGNPNATNVIVILGAGGPVVREAMELLQDPSLGVVVPHLYRPWSTKHFIEALPKTVRKVAVLDRSKDPAAPAEPLYMDVSFSLREAGHPARVVGGRYGLASRDFTPPQVKAVFDNNRMAEPKDHFTVGINDDVNHLSLPIPKMDAFADQKDVFQVLFWGLGGDGTIGANKAAIKAVISEAGKNAQGYFQYSADKSNSLTRSYLRFSDKVIQSQYNIAHADFVGCTLPAYVTQYPLVNSLKERGIFFLNFPFVTLDGLDKHLPADLKRALHKKKAKLYVINASAIAEESGLRGKISTVTQACFYHLTKILGDNWEPVTMNWIEKEYGRLGEEVVRKNKRCASEAIKHLKEFSIPDSWGESVNPPGKFLSKTEITFLKEPTHIIPEYKTQFLDKSITTQAASLPVSAFTHAVGGVSPHGASKWLKKGISTIAPFWDENKCIQCNACSAICPHAVIRPYLISKEELEKVPTEIKTSMITIPAKGSEFKGYNYRIQVSPYDCYGCDLCLAICPTDALEMGAVGGTEDGLIKARIHNDMFLYLNDIIPNRGHLVKDKFNVRNSQFQLPYLEFSGACAGCDETVVGKMMTQLFGPRMIIANASGCSSVWGGTFARSPFVIDQSGRGPAWARSLFEDNAEFGYGMTVGLDSRREHLHDDVMEILQGENVRDLNKDLVEILASWADNWRDGEKTLLLENALLKAVEKYGQNLPQIQNKKDLWVKPSMWIAGGDGWAYDIGFGGLDHIMASDRDFNIIIFDNELYANTGGQQSKATSQGTVAQFASLGKDTSKKDLGYMMMSYPNTYVASCALGTQADFKHMIKCMKEADSFPGPSMIMVYCNCIMHHIQGAIQAGGTQSLVAQKLAVESGYWPVYSYDPRRELKGKNPLEIVSKKPNLDKLDEFVELEQRFRSLKKTNPEAFQMNLDGLKRYLNLRYRKYESLRECLKPQKKE